MALVYENVEKVIDSVLDQAESLKGYAASQLAQVTDSVNAALAAAQAQFPELVLDGIDVTLSGALPELPDAPAMPAIEDLPEDFTVPEFEPAVGGIGLDLTDAPVFSAQAPVMSYPLFPAWQNIPMPAKPETTLYDAPDKPTLAFAQVPTLRAITLPTLPSIVQRSFDADAPVFDVATPETEFLWSEPAYAERFVAEVSAKLSEMLDGNLGLAAEIETAIWERARERESTAVLAATQEVLTDFAARGFTIPPGALARRLDTVRQKAQDASNTVSREIAIESAKLRIENVKFAVTTCIALEELLWKIHEARMSRLFEADKLAVELGVQVFNALVSAFNARNQAYATQAEVFKTLVEADMRELELYRTQLEGQKLIGELNQQDIQIMSALDARVDEAVKVYLGEIQAFEALQRTEAQKFDNWGKEIQGATALINQQSAQYAALGTQIQAETGKVNMFEAQARAYAAEVSGFSQVKQLQIAELGAQNDALRTQFSAYQASLQHQASMSQQALNRVEAATRRYTAYTTQYTAEADVAKSAVQLELEEARTDLQRFTAELEASKMQADYTLKRLSEMAGLQLKAAEMIGQVGAQIAAQSIGAVRTNLSADGRASVSANDNYNYSGEV